MAGGASGLNFSIHFEHSPWTSLFINILKNKKILFWEKYKSLKSKDIKLKNIKLFYQNRSIKWDDQKLKLFLTLKLMESSLDAACMMIPGPHFLRISYSIERAFPEDMLSFS